MYPATSAEPVRTSVVAHLNTKHNIAIVHADVAELHFEYADLIINNNALRQLPENGSIAHRIPTCHEGQQDGGCNASWTGCCCL